MKCPSGSNVDTIYGEHPHVSPHIQASKHNNIVISRVIFLFRIFPSRRRACGGGASATRGPNKTTQDNETRGLLQG